jgi:hypothetical protein
VLAAEAQWPRARRLVVAVPAVFQNEVALAARIYAAALARNSDVLYLGMAARPEEEPGLRRKLALLAAYTRDFRTIQVDYRLAIGHDWLPWVRLNWAPGDLVLCHREQRVRRGWSMQLLGHALAEALGAPVVMLEGFCLAEPVRLAYAARQPLFWAGALGLLAAGFWVQAGITQQVQGGLQTVLLTGSVMAEFALLAVWHRWLA